MSEKEEQRKAALAAWYLYVGWQAHFLKHNDAEAWGQIKKARDVFAELDLWPPRAVDIE